MQAAILSIGDELVLGQTVDTNSAWLSAEVAKRGVSTLLHQTIADDLPTITQAIQQACQQVDLVLISGGLGPTADDLTRQALADAMGCGLVLDDEQLAVIENFFANRGRVMAEANRVQAMRPADAAMVTNHWGTAPGLHATLSGAAVYVMPGVPREMKSMFQEAVMPELESQGIGGDRVILTTKLNTFGMGESTVADRIGDLMVRDANPTIGTTVAKGIVSVRIRSEQPTVADAQAKLDQAITQVRDRMGALVFSQDEVGIETVVVDLLIAHEKEAEAKRAKATKEGGFVAGNGLVLRTEDGRDVHPIQPGQSTTAARQMLPPNVGVATAESCTGGTIAQMLTNVPGSSAVVQGGWVTYSNAMKSRCLGVRNAVIQEHGAVSGQVAKAMAEGALEQARANWALSSTGIAGPGGGTEQKPVGTVWLGLARRTETGIKSHAMRVHLPGPRHEVRDRSAKCALQMLRLALLGEPLSTIDWAQEWA